MRPELAAADKAAITQALLDILADLVPGAARLEKYGGLIVERLPGQPATQFCGIFAYSGHVSLEFSNGAQLADPGGVLEGAGARRRHIKLRSVAQIEARGCRAFLEQAARL